MKQARPGMNGASRLFALSAATVILATGAASAFAADLQNLEDQLQIQQLWARYAYALDTLDPAAYSSVFAADALIVMDDASYQGRDKIRGLIEGYRKMGFLKDAPVDKHGRRFGPVRHVTTSLILEVKGNSATAESYWMEVISNGKNSQGVGNPPSVLNMGRYEDELVKRDGKWLLSKRTIIGDMFQPRPELPAQSSRN
jgi:hypothetical protein